MNPQTAVNHEKRFPPLEENNETDNPMNGKEHTIKNLPVHINVVRERGFLNLKLSILIYLNYLN